MGVAGGIAGGIAGSYAAQQAAAAARAAAQAENARLHAASEAATATIGKQDLATQAAAGTGSQSSAATGGALPPDDDPREKGRERVRKGQAGEEAVRAKNDIGLPNQRIRVNGNDRIPHGLNKGSSISEVKNTAYQAFTRQLKNYLQYARDNNIVFRLFTRKETDLSRPLQNAINEFDKFVHDFIPGG